MKEGKRAIDFSQRLFEEFWLPFRTVLLISLVFKIFLYGINIISEPFYELVGVLYVICQVVVFFFKEITRLFKVKKCLGE